MSNPWSDGAGEEEEDEEMELEPTRDSIMFLIDCRANMLGKNGSDEVYLHNALKVAIHVLKNKIISNENDLVGITFVGSRETKNANDFANVYELHDLQVPSAARIKELQRLLEDENEFATVVGSCAAAAPMPLHHGLWTCSMAFSKAGVKPQDFQRIWLFTNDDMPGDESMRDQAVQKAKDCVELNQMLMLWHMNPPGAAFDVRKFYARLIPVDEEDEAGRFIEGGAGNFDELLDRVRRKEYKKRRMSRIPFVISDDISLGVQLYLMLKPAKKPTASSVEARSNAPVKVETKWICESTGEYLQKHQYRTMHPYGGEKVLLSEDDMAAIKLFGDPSLRLLGFKPATCLRVYHNLRPPYFIFPDEEAVAGSTTAFAALHAQMLRKQVVGIAVMNPRSNAQPRLVALLPQEEALDDGGHQLHPAGMHAVFLPFSDDIRQLEFETQRAATDEQVEKATTVVQSLDLPSFSSRDFENPVLQKHWAAVQALALEEDRVEWGPEQDLLVPDAEGMARFQDELEAFSASIGPLASEAPARKRRAAGDGESSRGTKRARAAGEDSAATAEDWASLVGTPAIQKRTVPELKDFLREHGLPVSGKKAELIARVEAHFRK